MAVAIIPKLLLFPFNVTNGNGAMTAGTTIDSEIMNDSDLE